jgi:hypothetical protein
VTTLSCWCLLGKLEADQTPRRKRRRFVRTSQSTRFQKLKVSDDDASKHSHSISTSVKHRRCLEVLLIVSREFTSSFVNRIVHHHRLLDSNGTSHESERGVVTGCVLGMCSLIHSSNSNSSKRTGTAYLVLVHQTDTSNSRAFLKSYASFGLTSVLSSLPVESVRSRTDDDEPARLSLAAPSCFPCSGEASVRYLGNCSVSVILLSASNF